MSRPGPTKRGRVVGLDRNTTFVCFDFSPEKKPEVRKFFTNLEQRFPEIIEQNFYSSIDYMTPPDRFGFSFKYDDRQWEAFHDTLVEEITRDEAFIHQYRFSNTFSMILSNIKQPFFKYIDVRFRRQHLDEKLRDAFLKSVQEFESVYEIHATFYDRYQIQLSDAPGEPRVKLRDFIERYWAENPTLFMSIELTHTKY
eukprot:PhF_6_TR26416/c1_g1_i2/m.38195